MPKALHEIRDPVHVFVHVDDDERSIVDSPYVQRLRRIQQLAMSYLVYPGACHTRFEHSLGVMELAGRVFDVITARENIHPEILELMPDISKEDSIVYWRRVVRMAALCHDLGHLPFSHATEELLPKGKSHEDLSVSIIRSPQMEALWSRMTPPLRSLDVAKLAVGQKVLKNERFTDWEAVLSEVISSDAVGVDRMDYLLRDSIHTGMPAGRVDHFRLIETIRILPKAGSKEPELGVERGGLHAVEALLLARYFMFSQVYYHPVRLIYDIHLNDFLREWLPSGKYSLDLEQHLKTTDTEVITGMVAAGKSRRKLGHEPARRVMERQHFRILWEQNPADFHANPNAGEQIFQATKKRFGKANVRKKDRTAAGGLIDFPVMLRDRKIESAQAVSKVLGQLPPPAFYYVFISPEVEDIARQWLAESKQAVLKKVREED